MRMEPHMITSEAILPLLDHLCNEARNAMHSAFGLMEFQPDPASRPAWHTCLTASRSSADRLLRTIDDLRELVAGPPEVRESAEEFDLTLCAGEVALVLNLAWEGSGAKLVVEPRDQAIRVCHPRQRFEQTLTRLFKLALKLSQSLPVRVLLAPAEGNRVRMRILFSEPSPAERLAAWMNAQCESISSVGADSALVLAAMVAGNRVRSLGGNIAFMDDGLAIDFTCQTMGAVDEGHEPDLRNTLHVLVAEDCDDSYTLTALQMQNECIDRARSGAEAVEKVKKRRFDVVFMDIHMPGMDGYDAIRRIRDWETTSGNARTPIIILSSDDLSTQTRRAAQSGCSGFLRKPVSFSEISQVLTPIRSTVQILD